MAGLTKKALISLQLFVFAFLFPFSLASQSYYTKNITVEDGLPSNSVQDIFKDSRGYIWIGTEAGLCRYDGINFKVYTTLDGLPGNRIWSITEDPENNLWFACYGSGISVFNGKSFRNYSVTDGLVNNNVRKVEYSKLFKGLMIGTEFGFSFFSNDKFVSYADSSATDRNLFQVTSFLEADSLIYLFTYYDSNGFVQFSPGTGKFRYLNSDHRFHYKTKRSTASFITSSADTIIGDFLWGVKTYSMNGIRINDSIGHIFDITEDKNKTVWFASWNDKKIPEKKIKGGLYRYKDSTTEYFNDKLGIISQQCFCLYYDINENLLWIGTLDNGIYLFPLDGIPFFSAMDYNPERPVFNDVLLDKKGNMWVTAGNKIFKNNEPYDILSIHNLQSEFLRALRARYSFLADENGSYEKYRTLINKGLYKYPNPYYSNGEKLPEKEQYHPDQFQTLLNDTITDLFRMVEDSTGNLWIGSNATLIMTDGNSFSIPITYTGYVNWFFPESKNEISVLGQYEMVRLSYGTNKQYSNILIRNNATYASYCKYLRDDGFFWIYNDTEGIIKYKDGRVVQFPYLKKTFDLNFTSVIKDSRNNIIAGTNTGKIIILEYRNDSLHVRYQISNADGIEGSDIRWVQTDKYEQLWFASNRGLNKINLASLYEEGRIISSFYNDENGFTDKLTKKCIRDQEGNLIVISDNKLYNLDPSKFVKDFSEQSSIIIDGIEINYKPAEWPLIAATDNWTGLPAEEFRIPYNKNSITFFFHLLQFSEPSKARYRFKLDGFQKDWTSYTSETKAVFTNLSEGSYCFKINGMLLSDPDRITERMVRFTILPPWWKTWWFISLIMVILFTSSWTIISYRIRQVKKKSEINNRLASLKLEALKAQMNPHFIFNAFNSIQKYILSRDNISALNYMSDFAVLIRKTLDNSTKEMISLTDEISYLTSYLELEKRRISNLTYRLIMDNDIYTDEHFIPPMLIQPVVENSILHGIRHMDNGGEICIEFHLSADTGRLICTVEDNGIGRLRSKELYIAQGKTYSSMGSSIISQRAQLFGVTFKITDLENNEIPAGTRVEFIF